MRLPDGVSRCWGLGFCAMSTVETSCSGLRGMPSCRETGQDEAKSCGIDMDCGAGVLQKDFESILQLLKDKSWGIAGYVNTTAIMYKYTMSV